MSNENTRNIAELSPECHEVLLALRRITRAIDLHSRSLIQKHGLTGPQLVILHTLSTMGEVSISGLAKAISLGQATVTGILARLEKKGLISRRRSESDKRVVLVSTTRQCDKVLESAPPLLQESFLDQYTRLQDWERTLILSSLQRVVALMKASSLDATPILTSGPIDVPNSTERQ